jgi:hypothetical protein
MTDRADTKTKPAGFRQRRASKDRSTGRRQDSGGRSLNQHLPRGETQVQRSPKGRSVVSTENASSVQE